ncbi:MAG: DUF2878 domain-containing protein [Pseudomonadota bacterium]
MSLDGYSPWNLLNAALFQGAWFGLVLGAAEGNLLFGWLGVGALLVFAALRDDIARDLRLLMLLPPLGWCLDSLWALTGILDFGTTLAPYWIALLWASVALTLRHSMSLFSARPRLGALLAACSAPLCYLGGQRLGAVTVPEPLLLAWIALAWCALFAVLFHSSIVRGDDAQLPAAAPG